MGKISKRQRLQKWLYVRCESFCRFSFLIHIQTNCSYFSFQQNHQKQLAYVSFSGTGTNVFLFSSQPCYYTNAKTLHHQGLPRWQLAVLSCRREDPTGLAPSFENGSASKASYRVLNNWNTGFQDFELRIQLVKENTHCYCERRK